MTSPAPQQRRPRLVRSVLIVLALLFTAFPRSAPAEEEPPTATPATWHVASIVSGESAHRLTHYWSKGPSLRSETMVGAHPIVTLVHGDRYWVYDELLRRGVEIARSPEAVAQDATRTRPFANDFADLVRQRGELVETTALDGLAVEIWRVSDTAGRRTVWVTAGELKVPLRVENFDRASGDTVTLEYSNWISGLDLPDRAFLPPADLVLQRFDYAQYLARSAEAKGGPAPVLHPELLHGSPGH